MITIAKTFKFDVAHRLPYYSGKCKNLHGHTMKLRVVISGPVIDRGIYQGMVMDFNQVKDMVRINIVNELDHHYLNELDCCDFPVDNPTAENVVKWIYNTLQEIISSYGADLSLVSVRLWETENSWVEYK